MFCQRELLIYGGFTAVRRERPCCGGDTTAIPR
jgi:hypothetical protein